MTKTAFLWYSPAVRVLTSCLNDNITATKRKSLGITSHGSKHIKTKVAAGCCLQRGNMGAKTVSQEEVAIVSAGNDQEMNESFSY